MNQERNNKVLKLIDRYVGIPLVFLFGLKSKNQNFPKEINNIAILATAAIGDTLIMSGAINSIKEKYPNSKITLYCGSTNYEISKLLNNIDNVEKLPIKNVFKAKKIIQEHIYDIWIDFGPWPRLNSILTSFAKSNFKIGFNTSGQYRHFIYDKWAIHNDFVHEHENYCELLKCININDFEKPKLTLKDNTENNLDKYVVLHLFAGGSKADLKQLPLEKWIEIAKYIIDKGYKIYLTGSTNDFEKLENFIITSKLKISNMAGKLSLEQTAQIINNAKLSISIDTGIMHLASVLNCSLIAIHGPTSPKRWGPLSNKAYFVYLNKNCSPCISLGFESKCTNNICMTDITLKDITNIIEENNLL